jgi:hypothetical protein
MQQPATSSQQLWLNFEMETVNTDNNIRTCILRQDMTNGV